ncbi:hypothetical protein [Candidatus Accumulibacter sp. ACC007]|uniref:hypothetical protein n=1 Tax=Candidatus Accumulibacter sp. ACC007 TaxID=2823333 RepID=UPI0025B8AD32|nr:hypothetical protein [Candidatus Accumulibacter sp. ACC007]
MSALENLVRIGQLKLEPPSDDEIATALRKAAIYLADAGIPSLSPPGRFMLACDAAHALAFAALRASGYRPDSGRGHRAVVFQTLAITVKAPPQIWITLDRYHTRRNASEYGGMAEASAGEADDLLATARALQDLLRSWLASHRPSALS